MNDPSEQKYLFVVSYNDDSERKRAEYLFNNWNDGHAHRPDGLVRIMSGIDSDELYERLITKVPEDHVQAYELTETSPDVDQETAKVERTVNTGREPVESFLDYVFSKRKATLQSPEHNHYEVYTKKGRADVRYTMKTAGDETTVTIHIEGYPPAPGFLADFFKKELKEFSRSQQ